MLKEISQIRFRARFPGTVKPPAAGQLQQELAVHAPDILAGVHGVRSPRQAVIIRPPRGPEKARSTPGRSSGTGAARGGRASLSRPRAGLRPARVYPVDQDPGRHRFSRSPPGCDRAPADSPEPSATSPGDTFLTGAPYAAMAWSTGGGCRRPSSHGDPEDLWRGRHRDRGRRRGLEDAAASAARVQAGALHLHHSVVRDALAGRARRWAIGELLAMHPQAAFEQYATSPNTVTPALQRPAVDDRGQVKPALPGRDVSNIADHFLARRPGGEITVHQIGDVVLLAVVLGEADPPRARLAGLQAQLRITTAPLRPGRARPSRQVRVHPAVPVRAIRITE